MAFQPYLDQLHSVLTRIAREQSERIIAAGRLIADALEAGGVLHAFGTGHSHLIAHEAFYRAGGLSAVNPILDDRLIFLKGALESTRAERETGLAAAILAREDVRPIDAAVLISNSGRNAVPVEMALELRARGVKIVAITNIAQSSETSSRHVSGKRLFELADLAIDTCVPRGDAAVQLPGLDTPMGPSSTVAGAAIMNSIIIEAASALLERGKQPPILPSANLDTTSEQTLRDRLGSYAARIRYLDLGDIGEPS
ncbi:MAG: sugar isomerase domain-containing protein [Kofleriaceae bacterium]